jgi:predicted RNA-binding Zn ribbon-like protein
MSLGGAPPHPVDSAGLVLPEPSWPDLPGSAGVLEPLRRLCNSTNRENGADAWRTPDELAAWLAREGYGAVGAVDGAALTRFVALRDALWSGICGKDFEAFARAAGVLSMHVDATGSRVVLVPTRSGVDAVIARLALSVVEASAAGSLGRLKSCQHCRWVFHDTSKNRSGRWCSMGACGSRNKARAYRRRHAVETSGTTRAASWP